MSHQNISEAIQNIRQAIENPRNPWLDDWIDKGRGPVLGYACTYVPREIFTAAGGMPYRIRGAGSDDSGLGDVYLSNRLCSAVRHTMALALDGSFDFLEGEVSCNTCDHVRRGCDVWRHKTRIPFHGFVSVPRNARESLYPYFLEEIQNLIKALEEHLHKNVGNVELNQAIETHNRVRRSLCELDELRGMDPPRLSGANMLALSVASLVTPPEELAPLLETIAAEVSGGAAAPTEEPKARILLMGAELDEPAFVDAIESQGAAVVADLLCMGTRAQKPLVEESTDDPLDALCKATFFKTPCARMMGNFSERFDQLMEMVKERNVDGIIFQRLKFCDPWGGEVHNIKRRLEDLSIPLLSLEREYGLVHGGQVRTRAQAFVEMITARSRGGRR